MSVNQNTATRTSFGLAAGLLTACLVTLLSIIARHEPETVLFRAIVGATVVGCFTSVLGSFAASILAEQEDEEF